MVVVSVMAGAARPRGFSKSSGTPRSDWGLVRPKGRRERSASQFGRAPRCGRSVEHAEETCGPTPARQSSRICSSTRPDRFGSRSSSAKSKMPAPTISKVSSTVVMMA